MTTLQMFDLFEDCIKDYHKKDHVDTAIENPFENGSFEHLLYQKSWIDTVQWHLEDIIRDPEIDAETALKIKRRIDSSNQDRTDLVEKIDDYYLELFKEVKSSETARINTESPAWAIDRLSILALKVFHMELEANRTEIEEGLKQKNTLKFQTLTTQKADLTTSIGHLLEDLENGSRVMKVYRQMKMYNDPELNPVLYSQNKD